MNDLTLTTMEIEKAYKELIDATICFEDAQLELHTSKTTWEVAYQDGLVSGEITGKNENERIANARALNLRFWEDYQIAEQDAMTTKRDYKVAELKVKALSKRLELAKLVHLVSAAGMLS